ncbi:MAG: PIN domain-containing protein [Spirochaetota bacterium]
MILADTNIIIDYLKNKRSDFENLIDKDDIATCGIILSELIHGARTEKDKVDITEAIKELQWLSIDDDIWQDVGNNLNKLKTQGLTIPFQDAVLATLCINKNIPIMTNDTHFIKIAEILQNLKLF